MASAVRVPNKVIWALEDILGACIDARAQYSQVVEAAERTMDPRLMLAAARLGFSLNEIERKARDARQGRYQER